MLRRAIPVEGGLTTGSWCKHRLREGEAGLGARWRRRWCAVVAGTATPASSRVVKQCCCGCVHERGKEGEKGIERETRCGRLEGGRAHAREGATGHHPAGVAGMRPPRGARRLLRSGQRASGRERRRPSWAGPVQRRGAERMRVRGEEARPAFGSRSKRRRWPAR
jgi:hypothetical protein